MPSAFLMQMMIVFFLLVFHYLEKHPHRGSFVNCGVRYINTQCNSEELNFYKDRKVI